jgi:hypothetical protein
VAVGVVNAEAMPVRQECLPSGVKTCVVIHPGDTLADSAWFVLFGFCGDSMTAGSCACSVSHDRLQSSVSVVLRITLFLIFLLTVFMDVLF